MGQIGAMVADASGVGLRYARKLVDSIPEERFARMSSPGGQLVIANHPAFNMGHLTLYPSRIAEMLGVDSATAQPPAHYTGLFSKDAVCVDDVQGQNYPGKLELMEVFYRTYEAALAALRVSDDARLLAANPVDTPLKNVCPTLGSLLAFYMIGHVTSHLGQLSTWRRMEGMPSV